MMVPNLTRKGGMQWTVTMAMETLFIIFLVLVLLVFGGSYRAIVNNPVN